MQQLVIASNNQGKINEIRQIIDSIELLSLKDIGFTNEIDEPFHTFEENALAKASAIHRFCNKNVFADDSGICANALNGLPGVDSAHYSGERDDEKNLQKLLDDLADKDDRSGYYKAVICLIWDDQVYYFEGICRGIIIDTLIGEGGFGYDPIFIPDGYTQTFAQLSPETKNKISHRGIAVRRMVDFLRERIED